MLQHRSRSACLQAVLISLVFSVDIRYFPPIASDQPHDSLRFCIFCWSGCFLDSWFPGSSLLIRLYGNEPNLYQCVHGKIGGYRVEQCLSPFLTS